MDKILFYNIACFNEEQYYWDIELNSLFRLRDLRDPEIVQLKSCKNRMFHAPLYGKLIGFQNKIIGVPLFANNILIYDLKTREERFIQLKEDVFDMYKGKFLDYVIDDRYAYLIGYWSNYILKIDLYEERIIKELQVGETKYNKDEVCFKQAAQYGGCLYIPSSQKNEVFVVDKELIDYKVKVFKGNKEGFSSLIIENKVVWMAPRRNESFVRWEIEKEEEEYLEYPDFCKTDRPSYGYMVNLEKEIIVFPLHAPCVVRIDKKTKDVIRDENLTLICCGDEINQKTGFVVKKDDSIYIYRWKDSTFVIIGMNNCEKEEIRIRNSNETAMYLMQEKLSEKGLIKEEDFSISLFLDRLLE